MINKVNDSGEWIEGEPNINGQTYRQYFDDENFVELIYTDTGRFIEQSWVSSELLRTDMLVILPDYPHTDKLILYRGELREYDGLGDRPTTPTTPGGRAL